jgi:hypothetical protein
MNRDPHPLLANAGGYAYQVESRFRLVQDLGRGYGDRRDQAGRSRLLAILSVATLATRPLFPWSSDQVFNRR